jgi:D-alanyl-D-alanine endopeptidase (penicillin-binding protein 7)
MTARRWILIGAAVILPIIAYLTVGTGTDASYAVAYLRPALSDLRCRLDACREDAVPVNARSVIVADNGTRQWLYSKNPLRQWPIASLTKLLTSMVFLDTRPNLDTVVYISLRDCFESSKSHLRKGEGYTARDLLYAALMASDNRAARALATASGMPREVFVRRLNEKARSLGMMNTELYEVTGLDERNVSTAADVTILLHESLQYPLIKQITSTFKYRAYVQNKRRYRDFMNTNRMFMSPWRVVGGKTGYIDESDYCLATALQNGEGKEITVVVLGSPTSGTRFRVVRKLAQYGFERAGRNYVGSQQIARRRVG